GELIEVEVQYVVFASVQLDLLANEVRRAQLQALTRLALVHDPVDRDDRDAELADRTELQEVEAAHARELDVEQDRVGSLRLELGERRFGGVHDDRLVIELEQEVAEHIAEVDLVLDNQHPHRRSNLA